MNSLIAMVKNKTVSFVHYQQGTLWYVTECGFEFPVPTSDTGNGMFAKTEKAMLLMRWLRKHIEYLANAKQGAS